MTNRIQLAKCLWFLVLVFLLMLSTVDHSFADTESFVPGVVESDLTNNTLDAGSTGMNWKVWMLVIIMGWVAFSMVYMALKSILEVFGIGKPAKKQHQSAIASRYNKERSKRSEDSRRWDMEGHGPNEG